VDPFGADPRRVTTFLPKTDTVARAASILTYVLGEHLCMHVRGTVELTPRMRSVFLPSHSRGAFHDLEPARHTRQGAQGDKCVRTCNHRQTELTASVGTRARVQR
jgi:hypothetical protein